MEAVPAASTPTQPPVADQATTLEYDPKWIARILFQPIQRSNTQNHSHTGKGTSKTLPAAAGSGGVPSASANPPPAEDEEDAVVTPLELTVVRFDTHEACLTGVVGSHDICGGGPPGGATTFGSSTARDVSFAQLDIEDHPYVDDWSAVRSKRCWWGFNSRGCFGLVVPIKGAQPWSEAFTPNDAGGAGGAGRVLLPRSVTLEPPQLHGGDASRQRSHSLSHSGATRSPYASRNHSLTGTPAQGPLLSESFVDNSSFVRAMRLQDGDGSAAAALLQNIAVDGDLGGTQVIRGGIHVVEPDPRSPKVRAAEQHLVYPVAETLESIFGDGVGRPSANASLGDALTTSSEWVLSTLGRKDPAHGHQPTAATQKGGAADVSMTWASAGEMLPHFFSQKSNVTAASYAAAACKHSAKISFDESQFVGIVGDSKGLFLIAPGRNASEYCNGVAPLYTDCGGSMIALRRGAYDLSMTGHVYPSASATVEVFEHTLPQRLRLPSQLHRVRSIATVQVRTTERREDGSGGSGVASSAVTTLHEKLFTDQNVLPEHLTRDVLWASTVETIRRFPSHPCWREPAEMLPPVVATGRRKSTTGRARSVVGR